MINAIQEVTVAVAVLQEGLSTIQQSVAAGREDHKQLADHINAMERRLDLLVTSVENINTQFEAFVKESRNVDHVDAEQRKSMMNRISALEVANLDAKSKLDAAAVFQAGALHQRELRMTRWNAGVGFLMFLLAALEAWRTFHLGTSH